MANPPTVPRDIEHACRDSAYAFALNQMVDRVPEGDVADDLIEKGLDKDSALRVAAHAKRLIDDARQAPARAQIIMGSIVLFLGTALTVGTLASAMAEGGFFVICYGAIIVGAAQLCRGLRMRKHPDTRGLRDRIDAATDAARESVGPAPASPPSGEPSRPHDY